MNRSLLKIIKTRLEGAKGIWPDELPSILWAYQTTARTPIEETPFRLAYGSDAVIPAEVVLTSYQVENYDEDKNEEAIRLQLELVDEVSDSRAKVGVVSESHGETLQLQGQA